MKHKLTDIDPTNRSAVCAVCGITKIRSKGNGGWRCYKSGQNFDFSRLKKYKYPRRRYRLKLKEKCERCGFIPENICQLDIHHLDGNHKNNKDSNLQTLCACCHRYITMLIKTKCLMISDH